MATGGGLFRRPAAVPSLPPSQLPPSPTSTATLSEDSSDYRRRHGLVHLTTAFGLARRGSAVVSTSPATASRRPPALDLASPTRKSSNPTTTTQRPSPLSPKRKPLPKGSAFEKQDVPQDDELNNKMGKMDLAGGSTMVEPIGLHVLMLDCWEVHVL